MKKIILFALALGLGLALSTKNVEAAEGNSLRHAYQPATVSSSGWMRARIDNFSAMPQTRLVCVEAFRTSNGRKTHLGCLNVNLAAYGSMDSWASEFDAPTVWLTPGSYRVVYTYQAMDGSWHRIKSIGQKVQDGWYKAY